MANRASTLRAALLSWLAFGITFGLSFGIIIAVPSIRAADSARAASALVSITSSALFVSVVLGLVVRDFVGRRLGTSSGGENSELAKSGCMFLALPASFIAFFCTCAPIGLVSISESTVRSGENNWGNELMIVAWAIGLLAALKVTNLKRRKRKEKGIDATS